MVLIYSIQRKGSFYDYVCNQVIGYLLDMATVSFCSVYLESFGEIYFDTVSPTSYYRLPCDAHRAAIDPQLRTF
jgi:hypothetical protein